MTTFLSPVTTFRYLLQTGTAQAEWNGMVVKEYTPGDFFGELALESDQPRKATVRASGFEATVLKLPKQVFEKLQENDAVRAKLASEKGAYETPAEQEVTAWTLLTIGPLADASDERLGVSAPSADLASP